MIGFIIMGLILTPLFVLMLASVLERPRSFKVAAMFTSVFILQIVGMVLSFVVLSVVLGWIIPD